ncbi:MAG: hypothetical protein RR971_04120 [Alistipes sp.]
MVVVWAVPNTTTLNQIIMLQYINIKNKPTPINYGIRVMMTTSASLGLTFDGLCKKIDVENPPMSEMFAIVIASTITALNEGARLDNRPDRFTEDDIVDMIDCEPTLMSQFSSMMMDSMRVKNLGFTTAITPEKSVAMSKKKK